MSEFTTKYNEKIDLFKKAMNHEKVDHVPVLSFAQTWAIAYAGETCETTFTSEEKEFEVYAKHLQDMEFDGTLLFGMNRPLPMYDELGYSAFFFSKDKVTIQHKDNSVIADDEIDEYIQNPLKFLRNKVMYRRYPALRQDAPGDIAALGQALQNMLAFAAKNEKIPAYLEEHVGVPQITGNLVEPALDRYICYRGFQNGMADLRRRPQQVLDALEATYPIVAVNGPQPEFPFAFYPVVTVTYLARKMFEKFFWPTYKRTADEIINNGGKIVTCMEGKWAHVYDHMLEFPKGTIMACVESDDFIQTKKDIGDKVALVGGMPVQLLRDGTVQENIDHVRNIIDTCGMEGIILCPTTGLLSPDDVNPENMRAVCEFVQTYRP